MGRSLKTTTLQRMGTDQGGSSQPSGHERWAVIAVALCLCFLVIDRWLVLHQFGFRYVDDDQSIMWSGALEMARGRFHEPCFYGQRYNTMLEGLLAVPLLWMGLAPNVALPVVTSVLALFPFMLLSFFLFRQRSYVLSSIVLVLPVTMSPEFGMITSMPRGFVTGVFLASIAVLPLFSKRSVVFFIAPFFAVLALFANPNAALVLLPAWLLILFQNHADRRLYLGGLLGAIPGGLLCFLALRFYDQHPTYVVHAQWDLGFKFADIRLDHLRFLDELSPILWGKGAFIFFLLVTFLVRFGITRQWRSFGALLVGVGLLVISFGFGKVHDGIPSVFYPWARMFLAVPFLMALFLSQLKWSPSRRVVMLMPLVAAGFFGFKCVEQPAAVARQIDTLKLGYMEAMEVNELKQHCSLIDQVAREERADLLIVSWGYKKHLTNYGCPCLIPDFPTTMEPYLDRRTWWLRSVSSRVLTNILFSGISEPEFKKFPAPFSEVQRVSTEPELFLFKGNTERTDSFLVHMKLGMREL